MFFQKIKDKIFINSSIEEQVKDWRKKENRIVFTNGCFDIIHYGHLHYLAAAKDLGDRLIIGVNSDRSVQMLKGPTRPVKDEETRLHLLATMAFVDAVVLFDEETPYSLIKNILPDVLVKGGDWKPDQIVGADVVLENGGKVQSLPFIKGFSSTNYVKKIKGKN